LKNLRSLQLHDAEMTDEVADKLLANRTFAKLEELYLFLNAPLSPTTVARLKKRFGDGLTLAGA
jgi:hypothetical protein